MRPEAERRDPLPGPGIPRSCRLEPDTPCGMEPRRAGHEASCDESVAKALPLHLARSMPESEGRKNQQNGILEGQRAANVLHTPSLFYIAEG
jgi:hypothetical protein